MELEPAGQDRDIGVLIIFLPLRAVDRGNSPSWRWRRAEKQILDISQPGLWRLGRDF